MKYLIGRAAGVGEWASNHMLRTAGVNRRPEKSGSRYEVKTSRGKVAVLSYSILTGSAVRPDLGLHLRYSAVKQVAVHRISNYPTACDVTRVTRSRSFSSNFEAGIFD